jgi:hypothetical protein
MANGRNNRKKVDSGRDAGGFVALPWTVLDCPAYVRLSHPAKSLLMEFARQFVKNNNGRLLATSSYLRKRGWNSPEVITRAKRELLKAGFIFETVMGHRPNKASWYAVTWRSLDKLNGYDAGASEMFHRGAYAELLSLKPNLTRDEIYEKWRTPINENTNLTSQSGVGSPTVAPSSVVVAIPNSTSDVSITHEIGFSSSSPRVDHLEKPSPAVISLLLDQH